MAFPFSATAVRGWNACSHAMRIPPRTTRPSAV